MSGEINDKVATAGQPSQPAAAARAADEVRKQPELSEKIVLTKLSDIEKTPLTWSSAEIQSQLPTDILLITANDNEFDACCLYMTEVRIGFNVTLGLVYFGRFDYGNNQYVKVALIQCDQGFGQPQIAVTNGATTVHPKVILFVGICATLRPEKAKLGHVVISRKLTTYDDKRLNKDGTTLYHDVKTNVSKNMAKLFLHANRRSWKPPLKDPSSLEVKVHRDAVMLSGSELVDNLERREQLARDFPDALGLEMEGKGK